MVPVQEAPNGPSAALLCMALSPSKGSLKRIARKEPSKAGGDERGPAVIDGQSKRSKKGARPRRESPRDSLRIGWRRAAF